MSDEYLYLFVNYGEDGSDPMVYGKVKRSGYDDWVTRFREHFGTGYAWDEPIPLFDLGDADDVTDYVSTKVYAARCTRGTSELTELDPYMRWGEEHHYAWNEIKRKYVYSYSTRSQDEANAEAIEYAAAHPLDGDQLTRKEDSDE